METHIQNQNHSSNYGLLRFRSAPTSLLADFSGDGNCGASKGISGEGSDSGRLISRFMNQVNHSDSDTSSDLLQFEDKSQMSGVTRAVAADSSRANSQVGLSGLPPYYPRQSSGNAASSDVDTAYGLLGSSLSTQNSSPAGFSPQMSASNEYAAMKGMGSYGGTNGSEGDSNSSRNRLKTQLNFSLRLPSRLGILPDISEIGDDAITESADKKLGNNNFDAPLHGHGFPYSSWIESSSFGESLAGIKRDYHNDVKLLHNSQSEKLRNTVPLLPHQLSTPQTSSEVLAIEKFLQIQDSVPCRIRAKRGCATHPRSIAERVRRTRISERMRKLQELVPNMDKQTNTADMLDLAVDYIKALQNQFKALSTNRANCKCSTTKKSVSNQII